MQQTCTVHYQQKHWSVVSLGLHTVQKQPTDVFPTFLSFQLFNLLFFWQTNTFKCMSNSSGWFALFRPLWFKGETQLQLLHTPPKAARITGFKLHINTPGTTAVLGQHSFWQIGVCLFCEHFSEAEIYWRQMVCLTLCAAIYQKKKSKLSREEKM